MKIVKKWLVGIFCSFLLASVVWAQGVNINRASAEELTKLPCIGPKVAQRIIQYRKEHGPFKSIEELSKVKGIGPKRLERLRQLVTIGE